jgi:hypothetical protein
LAFLFSFHRLERIVASLHERLVGLFQLLFLSPPSNHNPARQQLLSHTISQIRQRVSSGLADCRQYLEVRARRNVSLAAFVSDFPGLLHFLYVDRATDRLTAPTLAPGTAYRDGDGRLYKHLKAQVKT